MKLTIALSLAATLLTTGLCAQEDPFGQGRRLWLPFNQLAGDKFVDPATGMACQVAGAQQVQDGGVLASQFTRLSVPDVDLGDVADELTVAAWIAPARQPQSYETILYKGRRQGPDDQRIHFFLSLFDGRPEFKFMDERGVWKGILHNAGEFTITGARPVPLAEVPAVQAGRWNHVAATFNRGRVSLHLNGKETLSGPAGTKRLVPNADPLLIGQGQTQSGQRAMIFTGLVSQVRLYGRALPAEELRRLYEHERAGKPAGSLAIARPLPEGYDPEFKTKLPLVADYERRLAGIAGRTGAVETRVLDHGGAPTLHLNGRPIYGMAMMPEPYVADQWVTQSCRDFAAAGVDLYSEIFWSWMKPQEGCHGWWLGEGEYDFDRIDRRIRAIIRANPQALIIPRIKLNPPDWWLQTHPDEITVDAGGNRARQASLASELWAGTYERMLRDVIRHMEAADYAPHIAGYHPAGGGSSEWFWWGPGGTAADVHDFSPAAVRRWRRWLAERYGADTGALRRAWGDPAASFEDAEPTLPADAAARRHGVFRHPVQGRRVIDYRRFLSDMVSGNIIRSCRIVKEETGGRKIAGVFYGYSMYCHNMDGFQGLEAVLNSPHVDYLAAPTAYDRRRGGEVGGFISAYTASYRLHNKLYWDEVDTRTHLYPGHVAYRTDTLDETLAVAQRAVGYSLAKGTNLWWFLLAGNATFHQAEVMDTIARLRTACDEALEHRRDPVSQVAVFADEDNMHAAPGDYAFRHALLRGTLDELECMGAPYDMYLLPDIANPRLPDYKLYIFLNAFRIDERLRQAIREKAGREGKTAVWVYAPGYVGQTGFSPEGIAQMTGISVRAIDERVAAEMTLTPQTHPITHAAPQSRTERWEISPVFVIDDPAATVLATTAGRPSLAVKELEGRRSVYSLLPLKREVLQGLCRAAGVHVYSDTFDALSANTGYVMLHTLGPGKKRITLPRAAGVRELVTGRELGKNLDVIEEQLPEGVTRIYRLDGNQ